MKRHRQHIAGTMDEIEWAVLPWDQWERLAAVVRAAQALASVNGWMSYDGSFSDSLAALTADDIKAVAE